MKPRNFISTTIHEYLNKEKNVESNLNNNFKSWFNNSKIVNDDGTPMICYHGTNKLFDVFRISKYGSNGPGIYLTNYKEIAEMHGKYIIEVYVKIESDLDGIIAGYEIVVKNPQNIKSVNNDGTWDINSKNIYS